MMKSNSKTPIHLSPKLSALSLNALTELLPAIESETEQYFGSTIKRISKLHAGGNSQIYIAELDGSAPTLLIKKYFKDSIPRLEREFGAFTFLTNLKPLGGQIPKVFWSNTRDYYGVYSFEDGHHKDGVSVTKDELFAVADFIIELQALRSDDKKVAHFDTAVKAAGSLDAYIHEVQWRLAAFQAAAAKDEVEEGAKARVDELQAEKKLEAFLAHFRSKHSAQDLAARFPAVESRLSPMDFSLVSVLFCPGRLPVFVDFEYFGWDDPLHMVADFLQHDRSQGIPKLLQRSFLDYYCQKSQQAFPMLL